VLPRRDAALRSVVLTRLRSNASGLAMKSRGATRAPGCPRRRRAQGHPLVRIVRANGTKRVTVSGIQSSSCGQCARARANAMTTISATRVATTPSFGKIISILIPVSFQREARW
jgi:hypothetical protein